MPHLSQLALDWDIMKRELQLQLKPCLQQWKRQRTISEDNKIRVCGSLSLMSLEAYPLSSCVAGLVEDRPMACQFAGNCLPLETSRTAISCCVPAESLWQAAASAAEVCWLSWPGRRCSETIHKVKLVLRLGQIRKQLCISDWSCASQVRT